MSASSWTRKATVAAATLVLWWAASVPSFAQQAPATAPAASAAQELEAQALFRFPVGGVTTSGPVVAAGRVWLVSDAKTLYVLTVDGVAVGKRALGEKRSGFIVGDAFGRAAISAGAQGLSLINRAGQEVWRVDLGAAPAGAPVFGSDGRLYVIAGSALLTFAPNGRRLWRDELPAAASSQLIIGPDGGPLVGLSDGSVVGYTADGTLSRWQVPAGVPSVLASCAGRVLAATAEGRISIIATDGSGPSTAAPGTLALGARPLAAAARGTAAGADGFYVLSAQGSLVCIDGRGTELWRSPVRLDGGPAVLQSYRDRVVVLTTAAVFSYGLDGAEYRTLRLRNTVSMPAMAATGTVFAGGADWIMYAYRFERALSPLEAAAPPGIELERVDAVAKEESMWSPEPYDDTSSMNRLRDIEKSVGSGTIGVETDAATLYLSAVALGRMEAPFGSGAAVPSPAPRGALPRAYACGILGMLGLPQAVPVLVMVFERDPDPAVRAAAAAAVASIGLDPEGIALGAFARATEGGRLDVRAASAVVDAIDGLYRASGALDDRSGIIALLRISGGDYPREVRSRAEQALRRISSAQ